MRQSKERKTDRVLTVAPIEGLKAKSSTGLIDPRLFTGDNKLHVIQDTSHCTWSFKYDAGGLPEPLKQKFTNFQLALNHAKQYFAKRNCEIVDIID